MPYSSGVYTAPSNSFNPAVSNTTIDPTDWIALLADLSTALSTAICKDGQTTVTANLPMGGFHHTGVLDPTATDQYMTVNQAQLGSSSLLSGTFTPTDASGAALTFTSAVGLYRRLPGAVLISMKIVYPVTADGSTGKIGGLPFTALNAAFTAYPITILPSGGGLAPGIGSILINTTTMNLIKSTGAGLTNADMSGNTLFANGSYPI